MSDNSSENQGNAGSFSIGWPISVMAAQKLAARWFSGWFSSRRMTSAEARRLEKQIKDFAGGGLTLIPQRQGIYLGALVLTSFFFSFELALVCYLFCQFTELLDTVVSVRVMRWKDASPRKAKLFYWQLFFTSTFSAI